MCHSRPRLHGCVEDHPALLLQLPVRVHSSHLIPPSAHALHLSSSPLHHRHLGHHLLVIGQGTAPSLVAVFVSRRVLAFSLAECWEGLFCDRPQRTACHDQTASDHLQDDGQYHLAPLVWSVQSCTVCLRRCEHLFASLQLVAVDWSICVCSHGRPECREIIFTFD
jgi:hypothetical protein